MPAITVSQTETAIHKALVKMEQGDSRSCMAMLDRILERKPKLVRALLSRSQAKVYLNDDAGAMRDLERARPLVVGPEETYLLHRMIGCTKLRTGPVADALPDLVRAASIRPGCLFINKLLGQTLSSLKDDRGAATAFARVLAIDADDVDALGWMSDYKWRRGDLEGSLALCDRLVALRPGSSVDLLCRARVRSRLGDHRGSVADFDRASAISPLSREISMLHIAAAMEASAKQADEAIEAFKAAQTASDAQAAPAAQAAQAAMDAANAETAARAETAVTAVKADVAKPCVTCGSPVPRKSSCKCHGARYCGRECQEADWPSHKVGCSWRAARLAEEPAVPAEPRVCASSTCRATCGPLRRCPCHAARYCGPGCQLDDWPLHKAACSFRKRCAGPP